MCWNLQVAAQTKKPLSVIKDETGGYRVIIPPTVKLEHVKNLLVIHGGLSEPVPMPTEGLEVIKSQKNLSLSSVVVISERGGTFNIKSICPGS